MRITEIRVKTVPISRYADSGIQPVELTTSVLALLTDEVHAGKPLVGLGFSSFGRFAQTGLIQERFAPRLLAATETDLRGPAGEPLDPQRGWAVLMKDEKPGGHGERCVAVGTIDMALWDLAAKVAGKPLSQVLAERSGKHPSQARVPVYAGGGYYFPTDDIHRLTAEIRMFLDLGYTRVKMKIGGRSLADDLRRIEAVLKLVPGQSLAVDAMNRYTPEAAVHAAQALAPYQLMWFEDFCDPLDFETHRVVAQEYAPPLATGEALFSAADARNLFHYAGLRPERDRLVFDPVHCYGIAEYMRILQAGSQWGWQPDAFFPHGGHLFSLHLAAGLRLGGSESNPHNFQPFGGFSDGARVENGLIRLPEAPGIGFETRAKLMDTFRSLLELD